MLFPEVLHQPIPDIHRGTELFVFNNQGEKVIQKFSNEEMRMTINVHDLSPGFYIIQLQSNGKNYFEKFIKN